MATSILTVDISDTNTLKECNDDQCETSRVPVQDLKWVHASLSTREKSYTSTALESTFMNYIDGIG